MTPSERSCTVIMVRWTVRTVRASNWRCLRNDGVDRPDGQGDRPLYLLCKPTVKCFLAVKSWDQVSNPGQHTNVLLFLFLSFSFYYYINRLFIQIILMQYMKIRRKEPKWPFWGQKSIFWPFCDFGPYRPPYCHVPSGRSLNSEMTVWHRHLRRPPSDRILTDRTVAPSLHSPGCYVVMLCIVGLPTPSFDLQCKLLHQSLITFYFVQGNTGRSSFTLHEIEINWTLNQELALALAAVPTIYNIQHSNTHVLHILSHCPKHANVALALTAEHTTYNIQHTT